jgi:glycosyltransferase involved in cell wall biosynthesis
MNNYKLKILYHHRTQGKGAEGVHIREIIKAFRELGHVVFIVSPPGVDVERVNELVGRRDKKEKRMALCNFWRIISRYTPQIIFEFMEIIYNFIAIRNISNIIRRENIELIYERNAFFCLAGTLSAKKFNIPIIIEVNEVSGIERIRDQILVSVAQKIERDNLKNASAVIVVSEFLKKHIVSKGIDANNVHVLPNAVDDRTFDPNKIDCKYVVENFGLQDVVVVGFIGGLVKWHNFEFLLQSFKEVLSITSHKIKLLIVGDGPLKNDLQILVGQLDLQDMVIFSGKVPHNEIPAFIKSMDICVVPHSNEYRSPIKMFEYMAMAKPVVAPRLEAIEEVITDRGNGLLFEIGNIKSIVAVLIDLINDEKKRLTLGKNARESILSLHTWKYNAQKTIELLNI